MARCGCASDACNCVVQAGDNVTVTGNGTPNNPYVVSATPGATTLTDTPTVNLTNTGTPENPNIQADVILGVPDEGGVNLLEVEADGLSVSCADVRTCFSEGPGVDYDPATGVIQADLSEQAGNQMTILPDGMFVPAPVGNVTPGCGLETPVAGTIQANVAAWPYACPQDVNATEIYCSPTTGELQGPPKPIRQVFTASSGDSASVVVAANGDRCIQAQLSIDLTNVCEPQLAIVYTKQGHTVDGRNRTENNWRITDSIALPTGVVINPPTVFQYANEGGSDPGALFGGDWVGSVFQVDLTPGVINNFTYTTCVENDSAVSALVSQRIAAVLRVAIGDNNPI